MPLDLITNQGGQRVAYGSVAERLLANGMDPTNLRTNAVLKKDEWILLDTAVVTVARERLQAAADLVSMGLVYNVPNGLGTTVVQHQTQSDMIEATVSMDGVTAVTRDRVRFSLVNTPLPVIHQDFQITARALEASRRGGMPLDTTQAAEASRSVAEKIEDLVINGIPTGAVFGFGADSGQIFGYTNRTGRNTVTLTTQWNDTSKTGEAILADVIAMVDAAQADRMYGPYILYVPSNYWVYLQKDFKANSDKSTLGRLKEIAGLLDVKVSDKLAAHNVVLVQMTSSNVDLVTGMSPTTVEWSEQGGLVLNFKVMAIMVPRVKLDYGSRSGVVHLS